MNRPSAVKIEFEPEPPMRFDAASNVIPGSGHRVTAAEYVEGFARCADIIRSFHGPGWPGSDSWRSMRDYEKRAE